MVRVYCGKTRVSRGTNVTGITVYRLLIFITLFYLFGQRYSSVAALAGGNVDHTYHSESIFLATITIY